MIIQDSPIDYGSTPVLASDMPSATTLIFEPNAGGGGFFQEDDRLLGTLNVGRGRVYRARFVINVGEPAYDLSRKHEAQQWVYTLRHAHQIVGQARRASDSENATLTYGGRIYTADHQALYDDQGNAYARLQLVSLAHQAERISVNGPLDLPLLAFYVFVASDAAWPATPRSH